MSVVLQQTILFFRRTFKLVGLRFSLNHLGRCYFLLFYLRFALISLLRCFQGSTGKCHRTIFFLLTGVDHPPWRLPVRCEDSEFLLWSLYQGKYLLWSGNLVSQDQWPPRSVMICNDLLRATVFANNVVERLGFDSTPLIDIILQDDKEFTESTECDQNPLVNCLYLQVVFLDGGSSDSLAASWLKFSTCSEY